MASQLITAYHDPTISVSRGETAHTIETAEIGRLKLQASVMLAIIGMPRRLGPDAGAEDLAGDKRRSRRVHYALTKCLIGWMGKDIEYLLSSEAIRQEATRINWDVWGLEHRRYVEQRVVYVATWGISHESEQRWVKSALVRLTNEQHWVEHALR